MSKLPDMNQLMKMAQNMAKDMEEKLTNLTVEGNAGGGMVSVVINGHKQLVSLSISPEVVDKDDIEMLQDLIVAAINDAHSRVEEKIKSEMGGLTGGLPGMPGGLPFPGM